MQFDLSSSCLTSSNSNIPDTSAEQLFLSQLQMHLIHLQETSFGNIVSNGEITFYSIRNFTPMFPCFCSDVFKIICSRIVVCGKGLRIQRRAMTIGTLCKYALWYPFSIIIKLQKLVFHRVLLIWIESPFKQSCPDCVLYAQFVITLNTMILTVHSGSYTIFNHISVISQRENTHSWSLVDYQVLG